MQKRRLQVFVSSTFIDLKVQRQAAVEAILEAGHIPAGMELFTAGDQTQMTIIRRWIDESDVYMLILGGRYGSLDASSRKSYTHLEYDYALENKKPFFALVASNVAIADNANRLGKESAIEQDNPALLKMFRDDVCTKMVKFWDDTKDIKLGILGSLRVLEGRENLTGWISGNEAIGPDVTIELTRLSRENAELRERIKKFDRIEANIYSDFELFLSKEVAIEYSVTYGGLVADGRGDVFFREAIVFKSSIRLTYLKVLLAIGKLMLLLPTDDALRTGLGKYVLSQLSHDVERDLEIKEKYIIQDVSWQSLLANLMISGIILPFDSTSGPFQDWKLTESGKQLLSSLPGIQIYN